MYLLLVKSARSDGGGPGTVVEENDVVTLWTNDRRTKVTKGSTLRVLSSVSSRLFYTQHSTVQNRL